MRITACPNTNPKILQVDGTAITLQPLPVFSLEQIEQDMYLNVLCAPLTQTNIPGRWSYLLRAQTREADLHAMDVAITPEFNRDISLFAARSWLEDTLDTFSEHDDLRVIYFFSMKPDDDKLIGALAFNAHTMDMVAGHITYARNADWLYQFQVWFENYTENLLLASWHRIYDLLLPFALDDYVCNMLTLTVETGETFQMNSASAAEHAFRARCNKFPDGTCYLNVRMLSERHRNRVQHYVLSDQIDTADLLTRLDKEYHTEPTEARS